MADHASVPRRRGWNFLRGRKPEETETEYELYAKYHGPPKTGAIWDLSMALAKIAVVIVGASALLVILSGPMNLRPALARILPRAVVDFITLPSEEPSPQHAREVKEKIVQELKSARGKQDYEAGKRPRAFSLGSTKAEVLKIQGTPTSAGENLWIYGSSEVYFVAGRVTGWYVADGESLHAR